MFSWLHKAQPAPTPLVPPTPVVSKITMGPKDILLISVDCHMPAAAFDAYANNIFDSLKHIKGFDRNQILLVQDNIKFTILSPGTPEYEMVIGKSNTP